MSQPEISVVVPAYDSSRTIGQTIASILGQLGADLELIVVDDGSTDETAAIVESVRDRDGRVELIRRENGGTAAARNTGWRAASAPLIAFLDDDDLWMPGYLAGVAAALSANPDAGFAHADAYLFDESVGRIRRLTSFEHYEPIPAYIPPAPLLERLVRENFVLSPVTIRASVLAELGGFDRGLSGTDDWDMWMRIAAAGHGSTHPPRPLILQRDRPDSQSKDETLMYRNAIATLEKLVATNDLDTETTAVAGAQMDGMRARIDQIARDAPIERARRLRRRVLAIRDARRTWRREPPAEVLAAFPEIAGVYGRPFSRRA